MTTFTFPRTGFLITDTNAADSAWRFAVTKDGNPSFALALSTDPGSTVLGVPFTVGTSPYFMGTMVNGAIHLGPVVGTNPANCGVPFTSYVNEYWFDCTTTAPT